MFLFFLRLDEQENYFEIKYCKIKCYLLINYSIIVYETIIEKKFK